jgi:hypothetical protein
MQLSARSRRAGGHAGRPRRRPPSLPTAGANTKTEQHDSPRMPIPRARSLAIGANRGSERCRLSHLTSSGFVSVSCHFLRRWIWPSRGTDDHRIDATTCTNFVLSRDGTSFQAATAAQPMTAACAATYGSGIVFGRYLHCNKGIQCSADEVSLGCSTALPGSQARSPLSGNEMTSPPDVAATQLSSRPVFRIVGGYGLDS